MTEYVGQFFLNLFVQIKYGVDKIKLCNNDFHCRSYLTETILDNLSRFRKKKFTWHLFF